MPVSKRAIGDVRPSQLITTFGPGAIVDLEKFSVIVAGIDDWINADNEIREPRLENALKVRRFFHPMVAEGSYYSKKGTIPVHIFPRYQVCPSCYTLSEIGDDLARIDKKLSDIRCWAPGCQGRGNYRTPTIPAPFIVACPSGHIDDFPWRSYVHRGSTQCNKKLSLKSSGMTGSIGDISVSCECGKFRPISDAFGENSSFHLGNCTKRRPWLGVKDYDTKCEHSDNIRAIQRAATNGWFPIVRSALAIKESASPIGIALAKCQSHQIDNIKSPDQLLRYIKDGMFPSLNDLNHEDVWETILKLRGEYEMDEVDLLIPEWEALRNPKELSSGDQSELFTEESVVPNFCSEKISRIVLARKLLEVRALTGFTRIDYGSDFDDVEQRPNVAPICKENQDWLPAVEVRGEGIFFELNENELRKWENKPEVIKRAQAMADKFSEWEKDRGIENASKPFAARYTLLHSFAHTIIQELALSCGYSAASVRERIYCSIDNKRSMSGVLLYTASPDSEGSLGGLVELGSPERLPEILYNALNNATRCSSDPLCADHKPDVHATINGAACHACLLVSETSCENFNRFLDRNLLVPTLVNQDMAYFNDFDKY